ncbi:MAG: hypothetical protein FWJ74_08535 [Gemmatimonadota bacterium]
MHAVERNIGAPPVAPGGFGIIELLIAVTILSFIALGMGAATARLSRTTFSDADRLTAVQLADERVTLILMDPVYDSLESWYEGIETNLEMLPGARRETKIRRVRQTRPDGRVLDYKVVTVTVQSPHLKEPVSRTATVTPR